MSTKTWTNAGIAQAYELELIDDAICDLISGQDCGRLFRGMDAETRKMFRDHVESNILDRLRAWREATGNVHP